jgi:retinol dehydrogenase-12
MTWNIRNKRVLLTGGNCGIGLATVMELCRRGAQVTFTARDALKGQQALEQVKLSVPEAKVRWCLLDLSSRESIETMAGEFLEQESRLDVLIHNAGLILTERSSTEEGIEMTFMVNHLGPFLLQRRLEPLLRKSAPARVIVLASTAHVRAVRGLNFDDLQFERRYAGGKVYGASKLANILFTRELAKRLEGSGVTANSVHPGVVRTRFAGDGDAGGLWGFTFKYLRFLLLTPERGARTSVFLACDPQLSAATAGYYSDCKLREPSRAARDPESALRLWQTSERLLQLEPVARDSESTSGLV